MSRWQKIALPKLECSLVKDQFYMSKIASMHLLKLFLMQ